MSLSEIRSYRRFPSQLGAWVLTIALACTGTATAGPGSPWSEIDRDQMTDARLDAAPAARAFFVDHALLEARLHTTAKHPTMELTLPRPEGGTVEVLLEKTATLVPQLARRHPEILTLAGHGRGPQGAVSTRITWGPLGFFRAWVREAEGSFFIEPIDAAAGSFVSYRPSAGGALECGAHGASVLTEVPSPPGAIARATTGDLDIFRLAVAATYEYNLNVGNGNAFLTYLWIISTINDVNGILEPEARVRLQLIPETADLIYVDANDPYSDFSTSAMVVENQTNMAAVLGLSAFDVGHVFSWNAFGGLAAISSVCSDTVKARGVSGWTPDPLQRAQIVAHEMGHHLGAVHTFNSTSGSCGPERSATTAWEAGAGTSLMSYGGGASCAPENVGDRLARLHSESREEIRERVGFATSYLGCGTTSPVMNNDPWVLPLGYRALPAETPFRLQALAGDADGDDLIFCWESRDFGAASPPHQDDGARPLFAVECGAADDMSGTLQYDSLTFPAQDSLLRGAVDEVGQTLPTTSRDMYIGISVRDDRGGYDEAQTVLEVTDQAGPFRVTSPNDVAYWNSTWQIVRWDVAGTTAAPVSCPKVDILLSTDGGQTFPTTLLSDTTNDGIAWVSLPPVWTTQGRIEVGCSNHVFFDVSDKNIWIQTMSF